MDENLRRLLSLMLTELRRMADAAEAQVKETKAMRDLVEAKRDEEIREAWNS